METFCQYLALMARALDIADDARERGDIEHDERDIYAATIIGRIVTQAQRNARALHSWFHCDRTAGEEDPTSAAPDEYVRQSSTTVKRRSAKGTNYDDVIVHGRAYVVGSLSQRERGWFGPTLPHSAAMSHDRIVAALETAPLTAKGGRDAIAIGRLTEAIFPDLPRLVGADTIAYEQAQPHDIQARRPLARPLRLRIGATGRMADGHVAYSHELLSPTDDGRIYVGHAAIVPRAITVRAQRAAITAQREAQRRTLSATAPLPTVLAVAATSLPRGEAIAWSTGAHSGTLSRSQSDRYSATIDGRAIRSQRSVKGLRAQVAALTA